MAKVKKCSTNRGVIKFYLFTILTLGFMQLSSGLDLVMI